MIALWCNGRTRVFGAYGPGSSPGKATTGCSAVGSAPALGAGGRPFEPGYPDKNKHSALVDFETNMSCFEVNLCTELSNGVMVAHPQMAWKDLGYRLHVLRLKTLLRKFVLRVRHS